VLVGKSGKKKIEPWERAKEFLDRISIRCAIDDAPRIYTHIDKNGS
jgi:hypothetical protein